MSSSLFDLTGKVALVTGSSKGIGKAIAEELARHGAQVVISSRKGDVCSEVAQSINDELADQPGGAVAIPANISTREALEKLVVIVTSATENTDMVKAIANATSEQQRSAADVVGAMERLTSNTAQIAGAIGAPCWTLLHTLPDWRWGLEGDVCVWYPEMRLFRQKLRREWSAPIEAMCDALTDPVSIAS